MSHERYPLKERTRIIGRNPEWHALAGKEHRPSVGDTPQETPVFVHKNGNGEAVVVPGVNIDADEAARLLERGAIFPLEVGEPGKATMWETERDWFGPVYAPHNPRPQNGE